MARLPVLVLYIFALVSLVHAVNVGVGFSLSLGYGTCSVAFPNGTSVNVAKVEGSPSYHAFMRDMNVAFDGTPLSRESQQQAGPVSLETTSQVAFGSHKLPLPRLPCWMGGKCDDHNGVKELSPMIKALKTASEAYLDRRVEEVDIVLQMPVLDSVRTGVKTACSRLSLDLLSLSRNPAGKIAFTAIDDRDCGGYDCEDCPKRLLLTADYSRSGLTASLFAEECGMTEIKRVLHNTSVGAHRSNSNDLRPLFTKLVEELPINDGWGAGLKDIGAVVLLGEAADDAVLDDAWIEALLPRSPNVARLFTRTGAGLHALDPVFAASVGAAEECLHALEKPGGEDIGCLIVPEPRTREGYSRWREENVAAEISDAASVKIAL